MATRSKPCLASIRTARKARPEMVRLSLPNPLPKGLKVVYSKSEGSYTLAATTREGIRNLLRLGFAGVL